MLKKATVCGGYTKMLPKGVEVTPEMMKNGPPSQEDIQNIIQQKLKSKWKRASSTGSTGSQQAGSGQGAPSGGGSFGPPAGTNFGLLLVFHQVLQPVFRRPSSWP